MWSKELMVQIWVWSFLVQDGCGYSNLSHVNRAALVWFIKKLDHACDHGTSWLSSGTRISSTYLTASVRGFQLLCQFLDFLFMLYRLSFKIFFLLLLLFHPLHTGLVPPPKQGGRVYVRVGVVLIVANLSSGGEGG